MGCVSGSAIVNTVDITKSITHVDNSSTYGGYPIDNMFKDNTDYWCSYSNRDVWIKFDSADFEIHIIELTQSDYISGGLMILSSDSQDGDYTKITAVDRAHYDSSNLAIVKIKGNHKKIIKIQFIDVGSYASIEKIKFFGIETQNNDYEEEKEEKTSITKYIWNEASTSLDKITLLRTSGTWASYPEQNMWKDDGNCWSADANVDAWFLFDCAQYNVHKFEIKVSANNRCKYVEVYTSNQRNADGGSTQGWKKLATITGFDYSVHLRGCDIRNKHKRFLLIKMMYPLNDYICIERIKFIGPGLDFERYFNDKLTLKSCLKKDEVDTELMGEYMSGLLPKRNHYLVSGYQELVDIELDTKKGPLSSAWMNKKRKLVQIPYDYVYDLMMAQAHMMSTKYEEENEIRIAKEQLNPSKDAIEAEMKECTEQLREIIALKQSDNDQYLSDLKSYGASSKVPTCIGDADGVKRDIELDIERSADSIYDKMAKIYESWSNSAKNSSQHLSSNYNVMEYKEAVLWGFVQRRMDCREAIKALLQKLHMFMPKREILIHKFHLFLLSELYRMDYTQEEHDTLSQKLADEVCKALDVLLAGKELEKKEKQFCKFLLCWQNVKYYDEMLDKAKAAMHYLEKPLIEEYERLQSINSPILTLSVLPKDKCSSGIKSNLPLLQHTFKDWYKHRNAIFSKDLDPIASEWKEYGLTFDERFRDIMQRDRYYQAQTSADITPSFVSCDDLVLNLLNCVAVKLNDSFQQTIQDLFKENAAALGLDEVRGDDIKLHSAPIKTKSRQKIKIKLDYFEAPHPQCMAVLDIIRCAVVCEDDKELCNLYELIVKRFSGKILRVKNAFDDIKKANYGYRAVLINLIFGDDKVQMVCEVQLLLNSYFQVRKQMHLGYGIVRSEVDTKANDKAPYYVLAQDSCKFGQLEI